MKNIKINAIGATFKPLVFGANVFGWTVDEAGAKRLLSHFVDSGFSFVDTADVYGDGASESMIGAWLKSGGSRQSVILGTKLGMKGTEERRALSRDAIVGSIDDTLRRLATDYVDVLYSHRDEERTPLEETLGAYEVLIRQGKVRAIGASNYNGARLRESFTVAKTHGHPRYSVLQPHYNLLHRAEFERDLLPVCLSENVSVYPYYALASGFLTGKYRNEESLRGRARAEGAGQYMTPRGFAVLTALDAIAGRIGATPVQIALAWLIGKPGVTAPIASATSIAQLDELLGAVKIHLSETDMALLDQASTS